LLAEDDLAFRGEPNAHDPWAISASETDGRVVVYDCVTVGMYGQAPPNAIEPTEITPDVATSRLEAAAVVLDDGSWKVAGLATLGEGLEECASSPA
jgi:hypothetical protein